MKLQPNPEEAAEFYKQLQADLEKQMEAEERFIESLQVLSEIPDDLFVEQSFFEEDGTPITEEELFQIIKEQEISEQENTQY